MAPRKPPTTTGRTRNGAGGKRRPENDIASGGKRQKTGSTTASPLIQAQAAPAAPPPAAGPQRATQRPQSAAQARILTARPTQPLNIYVMGANSGGELGLGPSVKSGNVGRPRLNPYLSGSAGVVQVSLGAMHGVALTLDNRILTWGVNDHGALGRDTAWEGNMVDADAEESDSDDEGELNPKESTPTPVDMGDVPPGTVFTQVAATDNATFVLTSTGRVYGWGTFRSEDGKLSFSPAVKVQRRPALILFVQDVVKICCGSNHVMALTADGYVYTWGRGTDGQLGRRFSSRVVDWNKEGLIPRKVAGLKNIVEIGSGSNHSFAVDRTGSVYGWGFNNAGQIGVVDDAGEYESAYDFALTVSVPSLVKSLEGLPRITQITGGNFHSLAVTADGTCLAWGRLYSFATGLKIDDLPSQFVVRDSRGKPSFLRVPTAVPGLSPAFVAAASEHSLAVTTDEKVYTWGLNLTKQIGHKEEEVELASHLNHPDIADKRFVWAGAGAQYSMIGEAAAPN
ncbi:ad998b8b-bff8-463e-a3b7-5706c2b7b582 [Thermothielavioides terrestris]|uniref:Ad998b8b-bff8-463e-a3b7-5706c2b7b582 n=1 Tax=Thermothielavioides terrestris TaxID=2587410 RepID=A0A3S4D0G0_9PEZI|nr:ad998b8b-bff8-463e-a3b7-5706c2b7b582 [Thermothielavioides terrestris]